LVRALTARRQHPTFGVGAYEYDDFSYVQSIVRAGGRWQGVAEARSHGLALGY
jgi:gamma-glutamyltranspeptidase